MEEGSGAGRIPLSTQLCLRRQKCTSTPSRRSGSRPCRVPPRRFWVRHASSPPSPPLIFLGLGDTPPSPPPPHPGLLLCSRLRAPLCLPPWCLPSGPGPALPPILRPQRGFLLQSGPSRKFPQKTQVLQPKAQSPDSCSGARAPPLPSL